MLWISPENLYYRSPAARGDGAVTRKRPVCEGSMAALLPAPPCPARMLWQSRCPGIACASQKSPAAPTKRPVAWARREARPAVNGSIATREEHSPTAATPMDVVVEDLRFLSERTGVDLLTPLQEVKEVHDQVCVPPFCSNAGMK